jgi:predicted lipid-binding transport protein (Tim44 family)
MFLVRSTSTGTNLPDAHNWKQSPAYARRRNSAARTRSRNCSGVDGVSVGGAGAGFGFTTAGAAASAAFLALRAASCASCLVAKFFASARPFPPASRQGRCVGHGKVRPGSRPLPFSSGQARRACREATSPWPRRSRPWRRAPAGERLEAGPEMRAAISLGAPRIAAGIPWSRDLARSDMEMSCPLSR